MENILIVESKNDKIFIQALIEVLNIKNTKVEKIHINEDNFLLLNNLDPNPKKPTNLIRKLKDVKTEIQKKGIKKIAILLDIDKEKFKQRFILINTALKEVFGNNAFQDIKKVNESVKVKINADFVEVLCYFTNVDKKGDLETLLKKIANKKAIHANCLYSWRECLIKNEINISDKDFDKFWISNYIRFDTCTEIERKQAGRKCSMGVFEYIMKNKKDIFKLSHEVLDKLKDFLNLLK